MIPRVILQPDPNATGEIPGGLSGASERQFAVLTGGIMQKALERDSVLSENPEGGRLRQWSETVTGIQRTLVPRFIAYQVRNHGGAGYQITGTKMQGSSCDVSVTVPQTKSGSDVPVSDLKKLPVILTGDCLPPVRRGA